jgi:hypothetical protein
MGKDQESSKPEATPADVSAEQATPADVTDVTAEAAPAYVTDTAAPAELQPQASKPSVDLEAVRMEAMGTFEKGVEDGSLVKALLGESPVAEDSTNISAEQPVSNAEVAPKSEDVAAKANDEPQELPQQAERKAKPDVEAVRRKTRSALDKGVSEGSLHDMIVPQGGADTRQEAQPEAETEPMLQKIQEAEAESMLQKAQDDLSSLMGSTMGATTSDSFYPKYMGSTHTTQASDSELREEAKKWVEAQPAMGVLKQEVDDIRELNDEARSENESLRDQNCQLQQLLARLLVLEASWDETRELPSSSSGAI